MTFTRIATAGAGTMGSQVAWQMAFHGKHVTVYDAIPAGLEKGKAFHRQFAEHFATQRGATRSQVDDTLARLTYTTDLSAAVRDADLISESVPESLPIKESFCPEASRHPGAHRVSDFQSIDRTWMITLQTGMGPCGMMDRMGLGVVYHVAKLIGETTPNTQALESARYLDEHFIEKGRLGVASGQGFYSYPNPAFAQPGFR
jgi:3-hydroxyacyl-CoA dehydrogenase